MNRDFKGIWIPKEIWLNKELTMQEKIFLVEVTSLDNEKGCFANNQYFSDFFEISKTRVSKVINSLIDKGFLKSTLIYKKGTKQILHRVLNKSSRPYTTNVQGGYTTKVQDPIQQMFKDNNTVNNTKDNNTINKGVLPKKQKVFSDSINSCYKKCLNYFPEHLHPKKEEGWLTVIDELNRIDKIPFEEIERITKKIRQDDFWKKNFLSLTKLRQTQKSSGLKYIIVFNEHLKDTTNAEQPRKIGRQTIETVTANATGWDKFLDKEE